MTTRQEAAERLLTQDRFRPEYEADVRLLLTPPLQSEVQEAVERYECARKAEGATHCATLDCPACAKDAISTLTTALSTASETEAAFIELMEADDPEPLMHALPWDTTESPKHVAWRKRQALKAAHKARYDALKENRR